MDCTTTFYYELHCTEGFTIFNIREFTTAVNISYINYDKTESHLKWFSAFIFDIWYLADNRFARCSFDL